MILDVCKLGKKFFKRQDNLRDKQLNIAAKLKKEKGLVFMKTYKSGKLAILNLDSYLNKMDECIG